MNILDKRILLAVVLPAIATAVFASVLLSSQTLKTEAVQSQTFPSVAGPLSARQMFEKGYATDLVIAKIENNRILSLMHI